MFASLLGSVQGAVPCSTPVTVTVTVKDTWCKDSHPYDYAADLSGGPITWPHISWPVVHTHDGTHPSWGEYATQGVADIATTGSTTVYINEMRPLAHTLWRGPVMTSCGGSRPTPPKTSVGLKLNEQNSWVSAIHMMAPSPDWITGITAVDMCVDGHWAKNKTVTGVVYDAGVDGGMYFRSANLPQPLNTNMITEVACHGNSGPFCNQANTGVNPVVEYDIATAIDLTPLPPSPPPPPSPSPPPPPPVAALCVDGYWPLFPTSNNPELAAGTTYHTHELPIGSGTIYYMPNGVPGTQHGEAECPAHATRQPPSPPPSPAPSSPCTPNPTPTCTKEKVPVCGMDGITYGNRCLAEAACQFDATLGKCCKDKKSKCKAKKCNKAKAFKKNCQATCAAHCREDSANKKCPMDKENKKCNPPEGKPVDCTNKRTAKACPMSCPVCVLPEIPEVE